MKTTFGKKRVIGIVNQLILGVAAALLLCLSLPQQAAAYRFEAGGFNVDFNSVLSLGMSYRVEGRDWDLIGKCNQREFYDDGKNFADPTNVDGDYKFLSTRNSGVIPRGSWSSSTDDGDLNFGTGVFSQVIKGTHDLDINKDRFGLFLRATWFYDRYLMSESEDMRIDIMENDDIKENHGQSLDLLDYFLYGSFSLGNTPVSLRIGSQLINWGESALMGHGLAVSNPIDAAKARVPGAESLKEAYVPQGTIWTSIGLGDTFGLEAYYQYEWEATMADSPGTYFSTSDVNGPGGKYTQFGYAQYPDYLGLDYNLVSAADYNDWDSPGYNAIGYVVQRLDDRDADDSGQFGVKLDWYAEFLNQTEFSLYYANYHSRTPIVNFYGKRDAPHHGMDIRFVYPEDIQLYGLSFNTLLPGGISCGGEIAYRMDEPYAIDGMEMAYIAAVQNLGYPEHALSQVPGSPGPGGEIQGHIELDSANYDILFTKSISRFLGAQVTLLAEFGATQIFDMPDQGYNALNAPEYLRLEAPGTDRSGNLRRQGNSFFLGDPNEGLEQDAPFADDFSWGYAAIVKLLYNDVLMNINASPMLRFKHDVGGTAPTSAGTFIEGRQQLDLSIAFDYQAKWFCTIGYTMFMGGDGTANLLSDRDYVSFDLKYAI